MPKERANEGRVVGYRLKLFVDFFLQILTFAQWPACHACPFGVTPAGAI